MNRAVLGAGLAGLAVILAACSSSSTASPASTTATLAPEDQAVCAAAAQHNAGVIYAQKDKVINPALRALAQRVTLGSSASADDANLQAIIQLCTADGWHA